MESKDLWVELKRETPSYMVLRGTYGEKLHRTFRMSRRGVRWRFWRVLNDMYVSSFETILFIESTFVIFRGGFGVRMWPSSRDPVMWRMLKSADPHCRKIGMHPKPGQTGRFVFVTVAWPRNVIGELVASRGSDDNDSEGKSLVN